MNRANRRAWAFLALTFLLAVGGCCCERQRCGPPPCAAPAGGGPEATEFRRDDGPCEPVRNVCFVNHSDRRVVAAFEFCLRGPGLDCFMVGAFDVSPGGSCGAEAPPMNHGARWVRLLIRDVQLLQTRWICCSDPDCKCLQAVIAHYGPGTCEGNLLLVPYGATACPALPIGPCRPAESPSMPGVVPCGPCGH